MKIPLVKSIILTACLIAVIGVIFVIGLYLGGRMAIAHLNVQMSGTQAMLAFNRISNERRLQYLLSHDCADIALAQVKVYEDQDMQLLAEFIRGPLPEWTIRYIDNGDPHLIANLQKLKIKHNRTWTIPDCRK